MANIYVHLGDSAHMPMQTVRITNKKNLRDVVSSAVKESWPIRIYQEGAGKISLAIAMRNLPGGKRRR